MSNIEFIVEVDGSLSEVSLDFSVDSEGCLNHSCNQVLDAALELAEVLVQECTEDCEQRGLFRELNGCCPEVTLESWIHNEGTGGWVHGSDVQSVVNVFQ
jgi:hypothetical protein